jgi:glycosyltransferase involved in cell wall biosynthesis
MQHETNNMTARDSVSSPVVTVVIPAYNARDWIGFTLESACAQTLSDIEVIVVDDGSSDGTAEIADQFALRDPRIRVIRQANAGVGAARNAAIREARGRFIAPLDADDLWHPEKLRKQVECMERFGAKVGLVYCDSWYVDENGETLPNGPEAVYWFGNCRKRLIHSNFVGNASVPLFRVEALATCGLYLTREEQHGAQGCEDWDLMLRVAEKWDFAPVPERLVGYRQAVSCMSSVGSGMTESYRVVLERARARNPDLPDKFFHWSEAMFQRYRFRKCFLSGDNRSAIAAAKRISMADRLMLLDLSMHRMLVKALIRVARECFAGSSGKPDSVKSSPRASVPNRPSSIWGSIDQACSNLQNRIGERRQKYFDEAPRSMANDALASE